MKPQPQTDVAKLMNSKSAPTSFVSRNHLWSDPNQSFLHGRKNPVNGETCARAMEYNQERSGGIIWQFSQDTIPAERGGMA